jgi:hypothetical protein
MLGILWFQSQALLWAGLRVDAYLHRVHHAWYVDHPNLSLLLIAVPFACLGAYLAPMALHVGERIDEWLKERTTGARR